MATQKEVKYADKQKFDLLEQVQKEPMLWDRQCDGFKLKDAKANKWKEIAELTGYQSGKKASDAWQVLKDEYTKQRKRQSGQGAKISWKFFDSMSFYAAVCDPRSGQSTTLSAPAPSGSKTAVEDDYDLFEDNDNDSILGDFSPSPSTPGTAPGKKRKVSVEMQILKTLEKSQKDLEASMNEESDENVAFGKSIGLSLQKLPVQQANWARMKMSNVLYQAQCWQTTAPMPPPAAPGNVLGEIHYNENEDPDTAHFPTHSSLVAFKY